VEIRRYIEGDEERIISLAERVFDLRMSRNFWSWKFQGSPFGRSSIVVAEDSGEIVGHLGAIRLDVRIDGSTFPAFQGLDAMVAPEHRGKGLLRELENRMDEIHLEKGAALAFGFANRDSGRLLERYGTKQRLGEIESRTKVTNHPRFLVHRVRAKLLGVGKRRRPGQTPALPAFRTVKAGDITMEETSRFGREADDLCHSSCPVGRVMPAKSSEYLNWRYLDHPVNGYKPLLVRNRGELTGLLVMGILEFPFRKAIIADCLFRNDDLGILKFALDRAVSYIRGAGLESLTAWMPWESSPGEILGASGFKKRGSEVYLMATVFDKSLRDVILKKENWYYTFGDSDVA
jgi:GNAT superfamily N-acetyltransferase